MITTFDRPDYLEECLASVEPQTLAEFRLVVLDNASTADYSGVLDRFRGLPVGYIRNETNIGAAGNFGRRYRRYSDSKYLVVFHDDDLMHPRMLEWQFGLLESDPDIQFVSTELGAFDDGDAPPRAIWENVSPETDVYNNQSDLARSLLGSGSLCFGSTMYRSSALKQIGPDDGRFGIIGDRPFLLDLARLGKSALIRAPLVLYRHHPGQDTKTGSLTAQNLIELMRAYRAGPAEALESGGSGALLRPRPLVPHSIRLRSPCRRRSHRGDNLRPKVHPERGLALPRPQGRGPGGPDARGRTAHASLCDRGCTWRQTTIVTP